MQKKSQGFTLVELSIVLVIIGLIVGGVVGGQTLIRTAKLNKVIQEISQYKMAIRLFKDEYGYLPGDLPDATEYWPNNSQWTGYYTGDGNGDGFLDLGASRADEVLWAWQQLMSAGYLTGRYSGRQQSGSSVPGTNIPHSAIEPSGYTFELQNSLQYTTDKNAITMSSKKGAAFNGPSHLNATDTKYIDKKIDDGESSTGEMVARSFKNPHFNPGCSTVKTGLPQGVYDVGDPTESCIIWFFFE